jgi:hypothetical protein
MPGTFSSNHTIIYHLLGIYTVLSTAAPEFFPPAAVWDRYYFCPHLPNEKNEAQRRK